MNNFSIKNPMLLRLSEEPYPCDPTPRYYKNENEDLKKKGVKVVTDKETLEFNSPFEAADFFDMKESAVIRAITVQNKIHGALFFSVD